MPADCILHVEHHELDDACMLAALQWAGAARPSALFTIWERYEMHYEELACMDLFTGVQ